MEYVETHILVFDNIVRELESADVKLDKPVVTLFLLQSMTKSSEHLISVLETLPVQFCTIEFVKARLLSEVVKIQFYGNKLQQVHRTPSHGAALVSNRKYHKFTKHSDSLESSRSIPKGPKCRRCNKLGNIARECPMNEAKQSEARNGWCNEMSAIEIDNDDWYLDSGASNHFIKSQSSGNFSK